MSTYVKNRKSLAKHPWKTSFTLPILLILAMATGSQAVFADQYTNKAQRILDATGVKGGLVVHLGCGDGRLTAELLKNDSFLVHGLDPNAKTADKARKYLRSRGVYGKVSADTLTGPLLPYVDNLVNLVVSENPGNVEMDEIMRVLCPGGTAYIKQGRRWKKSVKPWPADIDEWTHFLHDASNNAVARDKQAGPPRRLKWVCKPLWSRSHEFNSSLAAMVSANGRIFYIMDEGLTGLTTDSIPDKWVLTARDAFNGVLLWKIPMPKWGPDQWKTTSLRSIPPTVPRRIVAGGDRLYITLGYDQPVSVLDAATGEVLTQYKQARSPQEMRLSGGALIIRNGNNEILAIDTQTGKTIWQVEGKIKTLSLAAKNGKVFYQADETLFCVEIKSGKKLWQTPHKPSVSLLVAAEDRIVVLSKNRLDAFSSDTGKSLWNADGPVSRAEMFIANNRLWHWQGDSIVGRDLRSGEIVQRPNTDDVFTPGHHLRCYQSKATENFLITPNRGAEFISLTGGENTQSDWLRGACRYGIMPANGLLYVPPHPCFCYPGVLLTGLNALAPEASTIVEKESNENRLQKGPAYNKISNIKYQISNRNSWPTYRHDAQRSGATVSKVGPTVKTKWNITLPGPLTPPVSAGDKVYVAAKDEHTLYALAVGNGSTRWHFTASGRIDSPPTIHGETVLFGSADGHVYCLRTSDGRLVWRFRAAPTSRRIIAFGQLESPWRVHGSILIKDGLAYCTAGRSTHLDGGIYVFALDPGTGEVRHETVLDTWARTREDAENKPFVPGYHIEGANSDILVSEGDYIYFGQFKLDTSLRVQEVPYTMPDPDKKTVAMDLSDQPFTVPDDDPKKDYEDHQRKWIERVQPKLIAELNAAHGGYSLGQRRMGRHLISTGGFLDDSWFNRTYWMYADNWPGYYLAHRGAKTGQLLVIGPDKTYAVQAFPSRGMQSPLFTPGDKGYLLVADDNDNEPILDDRTWGTTKGWGYMRTEPPVWHDWLGVRIRAMVLAGQTLFIAGPPDVVDAGDPMAAFEGRRGGLLWAISEKDGKIISKCKLDAPPVFDGMIAAGGKLFVSTTNGNVICFSGE